MQVDVNGILTNFELRGKPDGQVVVLSHSLGSSLVMWNPQIASLETRYRVLRYDTRGHGGSQAVDGAYTLDQLTDDAVGLMDALGLDKVIWIGLSMGGMIGQSLAVHHQDRLKGLVLCDTAAVIPEENRSMFEERIRVAGSQSMEALASSFMERWFTPPYLVKNPPEVAVIRDQFVSTPVPGFIGCCEAIKDLNLLDQLSGIYIPVLIIVGEDDPGTPVAASEAMHEQIEGSRLVILPSASHLSNVEQAGAFNEALIGFLQEHF